MKKAILLVNLGTPEELSVKAVRKYLKEFLLDPYVIDLPWVFRQLLVRGIIAPFRAPKSFEAYEAIWEEAGSPLMTHSQKLTEKLNEQVDCDVYLAMRYGNPSIKDTLLKMKAANVEEIICVPLYPQYALSTTETVKQKVLSEVKQQNFGANIKFVEPFFNASGFIGSLSQSIQPYLGGYDHILFSYHGLPERHITKLDSSKACFTNGCCENPEQRIKFCYRAQCVQTTQLVREQLNIPAEKLSLAFQSRIGKGWLTPYTDESIESLAEKGVKKLAVVCPSFLTDCLETLEEIQLQGEEAFKAAGGEELKLIPCLNSEDHWVTSLKQIILNG